MSTSKPADGTAVQSYDAAPVSVSDEQFAADAMRIQEQALARLTEKQKQVLKEEFKIFDKDNSGLITKKELASVLRDLGVYKTTAAEERGVDEMMKMVDKDGDSRINEKEFMTMMALSMRNAITEEELMDAFSVFDQDSSGTVNLQELHNAIKALGPRFLSEQECEELMKAADYDGNGVVDYAEFVRYFLNDGNELDEETQARAAGMDWKERKRLIEEKQQQKKNRMEQPVAAV